jgi:hypothetical protein
LDLCFSEGVAEGSPRNFLLISRKAGGLPGGAFGESTIASDEGLHSMAASSLPLKEKSRGVASGESTAASAGGSDNMVGASLPLKLEYCWSNGTYLAYPE